jgi:hypothetical protein
MEPSGLVYQMVVIHTYSDFEGCADILTSDRTPQKVTIESVMPYANVDIFREKGAQIKKKKFGGH